MPCKEFIDWDVEMDRIIWRQAIHPGIPTMFLIACCPDCEEPMVFDEPDGKSYVYITIEGNFYKLWITLPLPSSTSQSYTQ